MIILTATTDNVQVVLAGNVTTNQLPCYASWRDITTTAYTPGRTLVNTNNTTDVNVVPAPAASTQRVADYIAIYNADTVAAVVTVKFDANGTEYVLWKGTLNPNERVEYVEGAGFSVYTDAGAQRVQSATGLPATSVLNVVATANDISDSSGANTVVDATGLSFAVTSGYTYWFRTILTYTAAATSTGIRTTVNGPAMTYIAFWNDATLTATTRGVGTQVALLTPAAAVATSLTAGNIATMEGIFTPSADGTFQVQFGTEVDTSAVVLKAGSLMFYMRTK